MGHDDGVPESNICGCLRDEEKLCDSVNMVNSTDGMKIKWLELPNISFQMVWERELGCTPISDPVLSIQAQQLCKDLYTR